MSLLATLRAKKQIREAATLTVATAATDRGLEVPSVARVATVAVASLPKQQFEASEAAANDTATTPSADPDRCCWPHSEAMNGREIDTFTARLARFTDKGLSLDDAERLADKLVIRDREGDDRRLCLECAHLHGAGRWRCGNWQRADVARDGLARDLVLTLQRCNGFIERTP